MVRSALKKKNCVSSRQMNCNKHVHFANVEIYTFPRLLGDNPGVSCGVPLTIGWDPIGHESIGLDLYEYLKKPATNKREFLLSSLERTQLLLSVGYSIKDIIAAADKIAIAKKERLASLQKNNWDKIGSVLKIANAGLRSFKSTTPNVRMATSA